MFLRKCSGFWFYFVFEQECFVIAAYKRTPVDSFLPIPGVSLLLSLLEVLGLHCINSG